VSAIRPDPPAARSGSPGRPSPGGPRSGEVPAVRTSRLARQFDAIRAVDGLDLLVHSGELFGLVGPDGAGKTTTIRLLCGLLRPTSGEARVLGLDTVRDAKALKRTIGYLSQKFSLYGDLTVDENIEFFAEVHGVADFTDRRNELLAFTRLEPFRKRLADRLSGGMRQKLALACTLVHTPRIVFLDEPTTGVDPVSRRDFWKILSGLLKTGITIVMTTPYLDEAERCSRVGLMHRGRLVVADTPVNLKSLMKGTVVEIVCSETRRAFKVLRAARPDVEAQLFGDRLNLVVGDAARETAAAEEVLRREGIEIFDRRILPPSLENVFISVTRSADTEVSP
jgi:ABC-2 type transport system ATP-binding protein